MLGLVFEYERAAFPYSTSSPTNYYAFTLLSILDHAKATVTFSGKIMIAKTYEYLLVLVSNRRLLSSDLIKRCRSKLKRHIHHSTGGYHSV